MPLPATVWASVNCGVQVTQTNLDQFGCLDTLPELSSSLVHWEPSSFFPKEQDAMLQEVEESSSLKEALQRERHSVKIWEAVISFSPEEELQDPEKYFNVLKTRNGCNIDSMDSQSKKNRNWWKMHMAQFCLIYKVSYLQAYLGKHSHVCVYVCLFSQHHYWHYPLSFSEMSWLRHKSYDYVLLLPHSSLMLSCLGLLVNCSSAYFMPFHI